MMELKTVTFKAIKMTNISALLFSGYLQIKHRTATYLRRCPITNLYVRCLCVTK